MNKTRISASEIIPLIEPALNHVPDDQTNSVRFKIAAALLNQKPNTPNTSKEETYALKQLRKDGKIVIMKADKGNTTVVMNNSDYERKVNEHLHNGPYEKIIKNKCRATLNKLKAETAKMLQKLKSKLEPSL
ncbi:unnamed protein product [Schistosoma mattheei]|uniref:Uncharacterized protein n=1 Tax=Schistosoma mattheei TaxID=31246 RepID=A0A183PED5_9TREM|nr:unnamed protein product [Schistosoma mattheei]